MRSLRPVLGAILVWLLSSGTGWTQAVAGSQLAGAVRDSSGGVLPGASVTITKTDTGMTRTIVTGPDGGYVFPNLPVGPYQLKVALAGFNTYVQDGIILQVNTNPTVEVTLSVGNLGEQVTVFANTAMVETRSTGVGQVIDNERVNEIPLNGRQATELIFLSGLATSAPAGDLNTNKNYPTVTISVAGGQANGMTYIMDGGTHNDPFNNLNLPTPFPDAIQEFKVETSSLPARYGHHAASAVNVVTKSGSNRFNGNVFEFVRNYRFNARNFFAPERDSLKRNQFGGTLGGPLLKDRLFFFGGYQGKIERSNPAEAVSFVPTQAMLSGDFTAVAAPSCSGRQVVLAPGSGFTDNRIDPARFSPIAMEFLEHVPVATDPCGRLQYGIPNNNTEHQTLAKLDFTITRSQTVFGRYLYAVYDNPGTYDGKNVLTLSRTGQNNQAHSVVRRAQLVPVLDDCQCLPRHVQQDTQRQAAPAVLLAGRPRRRGLQPAARVHRRHRDERLRNRRRRDQPRVFRFRQLPDRQRRRRRPGTASDFVRGELDSNQDRDAEQPPDQRAVHLQRADDGARACRFHARPRERVPPGQSRLRLRRERLRRRVRAGRVEDPREPDAQRRPAVGTVSPHQEHARLQQQFRQGALRSGHPQPDLPAGPAGTVFPRGSRLPRERGDEQQAGPVRAAGGCDLGPGRVHGVSRRAGASSTTRRTCSSTRASPTIRRGAPRSRSRIRRAGSPIPISTTRAGIPSRRWRPAGRRNPFRPSAST